MTIVYWIAGIVLVAGILYFLDREIYFYEGARLGTRLQGWLYDRWAGKYDAGKAESQARDHEMLARPLLGMLAGVERPFVLDVATGTGRLPLVLCREPGFTGQVIAMDISDGMLEIAAGKLAGCGEQVTLLHYADFPLPFPDGTFEAVTCLEALEVMAEMEAPLKELFRVLKPGGAFLSSRGTEASGRKAKVRGVEAFTRLLEQTGFEQVEIVPWWRLFDRVRAVKPGVLHPDGERRPEKVLICPGCGEVGFDEREDGLACGHCGRQIKTGAEGIVLYA
ncbi:MAG: class I SAM-dependent methyltransferase [Chloroflexota bacterium]